MIQTKTALPPMHRRDRRSAGPGAAGATAVEIDELAIAVIEVNAGATGVDVTAVLGDVLEQEPEAAVVLAGDVFYSRGMTARMLGYLRRAAGRGATVLVGDP